MKRNKFFIFFIGFLLSQRYGYFIGQVYLGELLSFFYLLFNFNKLIYSDFEKKLIKISLIVTLVQLTSNFYNNANLIDSVKGFFHLIVFFSAIICMNKYLKYLKDFELIKILYIGTIAGGLFVETQYSIYIADNPWKWGVGSSLINLIMIIYFLEKKNFSKVAFFTLSLVVIFLSIKYNARSLLAIYLASIIFYFIFSSWKNIFLEKIKNYAIIFIPVFYILILSLGAVVYDGYSNLFLSPSLAEVKKNEMQNQGDLGVIVGARGEFIASYYAFVDRPWLGHGSYAKDIGGFYQKKRDYVLLKYNYFRKLPRESEYQATTMIPGHSMLMDNVIRSGVIALFFWVFLTNYIMKNFIDYSKYFSLFFYYQIINYTHQLFFSPWGGGSRWGLAVLIALLIASCAELEKKYIQKNNL